MSRWQDTLVTAFAPTVWGSTYIVTTEMLPSGYPVTLAVLRALPAGLLLLIVTRQMPPKAWLGRTALLGALNFAIFWSMLFITAYRLPGGVAATLASTQTLMVIGLARGLLGTPVRAAAVVAAVGGVGGVGLLLLGPKAALDPVGLAAGLIGALSMAAGTVLSRKWKPPVPALSFAAWQLTAGGLLLVPIAFVIEPPLPVLSPSHLVALLWLGLIGAALTYWVWFRGIARLEPSSVSMLGMLSPLTAVLLGWVVLGEVLTPVQLAGAVVIIVCIGWGQAASRPMRRRPA